MPSIKRDDQVEEQQKLLLQRKIIAEKIARRHGSVEQIAARITLEQYVERIRRHPEVPFKLDLWQRDLCRRLEKAFWCANARKFKFVTIDIGAGAAMVEAPSGFRIPLDEFEGKKDKGTLAAIHAPPQFGKSNIISVAYPAWILGYDPIHRFRLATYNILHSTRFSVAIQRIMRSPEHRAIFTDPKGHLPVRTKFVEWSTQARIEVNDGQSSFVALGLRSGFVGTGADTLLQDDPYASAEDARSETIRDTTWRFQSETAKPRLREYSNNFIMFHRYHNDDQGGRAIATGDFELWRYPAIADGPYVSDELGGNIEFPCLPLDRTANNYPSSDGDMGGYLSARYPKWYYDSQRYGNQTGETKKELDSWNAQFQGRPTSKEGTMFDVGQIKHLTAAKFAERKVLYWVRSWDDAATEGSGDFTAGPLVGIDASRNIYVTNIVHGQWNTGQRKEQQSVTAATDGLMVPIHYPEDPGASGKGMAWLFKQEFEPQGYTVIVEGVSGSKTARADPSSTAVNQGRVYVIEDDGSGRYLTPQQIKVFKAELRDFPFVGKYDDQVDAFSDAVTYLEKLLKKGRVIKVNGEQNIIGWSSFNKKFSDRIPGAWEVGIACRVASNPSLPSGYAMVARASENAKLGECVFVVASARMYVADPGIVFKSVKDAIKIYCAKGEEQVQAIWIAHGNDEAIALAGEKYDLHLQEFQGDEEAGLLETAWYFGELKSINPFYDPQDPMDVPRNASRCYVMADDRQITDAVDERGQLSLRQDLLHWSFTDQGKPQPFGGIVLDCVRMTLYNFWLSSTELTKTEREYGQLPEHLQPEAIAKQRGTQEFVDNYWAQQHELAQIREREREREELEAQPGRFVRPVRHERYHRKKS